MIPPCLQRCWHIQRAWFLIRIKGFEGFWVRHTSACFHQWGRRVLPLKRPIGLHPTSQKNSLSMLELHSKHLVAPSKHTLLGYNGTNKTQQNKYQRVQKMINCELLLAPHWSINVRRAWISLQAPPSFYTGPSTELLHWAPNKRILHVYNPPQKHSTPTIFIKLGPLRAWKHLLDIW